MAGLGKSPWPSFLVALLRRVPAPTLIRVFQQFIPKRKLLLVVSETVLLAAGLLLGTCIPGIATHDVADASMTEIWRGVLTAVTIAVLCQVSLSYNDLYDWSISSNRLDLPNRLLHAAGFSLITLSVIVFFFPSLFYFPSMASIQGQTWKLVLVLGACFVLIYWWRIGFHWFFYKWGRGEKLLILGTGKMARELCDEILSRGDTGFEIVGCMGRKKPDTDFPSPWLGGPDALPEVAVDNRVSRVVVALEQRRGELPVKELLQCRLAGMRVEERDLLFEQLHGRIGLESLRPSYLIFGAGFRKSRLVFGAKRSFDILLALIGILLALPLMLVVAVLVKLDSEGPVFFQQTRTGLDGRDFTLLKFRSMRADAEKHSGPVWAQKSDDRITRFGKFMRNTRLDELPQMFNILVGDMSWVGPRPERPFFVKQLSDEIPYYMERLTVRPGLTGWAQIKYPYGASIADARRKLEFDLYYVKNMTPLFDLSILLRTVKVVLFRRGSR